MRLLGNLEVVSANGKKKERIIMENQKAHGLCTNPVLEDYVLDRCEVQDAGFSLGKR